MKQSLINPAAIICRAQPHIDSRLNCHGERVAYILMKIFEDKNEISHQEKQDIFMLGLLHDIGVYKEEEINTMLSFDSHDSMEHSVLGYLLLRTFSPLQEFANVILYHQHPNAQYYSVPISEYYRRLARLLFLADRIDVFCELNDAKHLPSFFNGYCKGILTAEDIQWFQDADRKFHIVEHLLSNAYHEEVKNYTCCRLDFSDSQMYDFLCLYTFSFDFRNEYTALHTNYAVQFSQKIAESLRLSTDSWVEIKLASLLHNIGKISLSDKIESMEDYDRYLKELYQFPTQDNTIHILKDTVNPKLLQIIEQSFRLLDCWSSGKKITFSVLQESEVVALSYLLSNALTLDQDIGAHHDQQLLAFLKDRYHACGMNTNLLLSLEKEYNQIIHDSQAACMPMWDIYKQMMAEHRSLGMILQNYNRKYH